MDKSIRFTPNKEQACKIANGYWADLSDYREKFLDKLSEAITYNAQAGNYTITQEILKNEKEYIKEKLEDVGYNVSFIENSNSEKYDFIVVSFKEK
ncbi:MAG: hypothetical protein RSC84_02535 [Peptostreptococcaceae bacterium]|uniref:hypothetical protein n=1 Tax=Clostridium sp. TaxID=1506 RepID=UPI003051729C